MKKPIKNTLFLLLVLVFMICVTSCNSKNGNEINNETTYVVEFDNQGHGVKPDNQVVAKGSLVTEPEVLTEDGWDFGGWYNEADCISSYSFQTPVISNLVLYAKWSNKAVTRDATPTIYLAGDSTVQTYADSQYIAGWGQYLDLFLDDSIEVVNAARGGRSSRSFINEDRLYKSDEATSYSFNENNGKAIEETIKEGDYLFVQFGHNDDNTKGYSTMADRMVPLGEPDSNGIYPIIAPTEKKSTTYLPAEYTSQATTTEITKMQTEIAKYGSTYYAYGDGTYKWYLKQYIDFARSKGAIPVLLSPVARVKFSGSEIIGGAGLHGENFAYVEAVRQLANEEDCLFIDNFLGSKEMLEVATSTYADYLMALVPNSLDNGAWPSGYDSAYGNADVGFEKIEATHYNKYGAYLTAAYVAEAILTNKEKYTFSSNVHSVPEEYVDPSNRISISKVEQLEGLFDIVNPTNPNRTYVKAQVAIDAILALTAKGAISTITSENYELWNEYCNEARGVYESLNYDYRSDVTNYSTLLEYEAAVIKAKPKPDTTVVFSANNFTSSATPVVVLEHTFSFDTNIIEYAKTCASFSYNDVQYSSTSKSVRLAGNGSITGTQTKYIEFTTEKACTVTIVASGGGVTNRFIQMADVNKKLVASFEIEPTQTVVSNEIDSAGTYRIASSGSNIDVYYIIIEYYN